MDSSSSPRLYSLITTSYRGTPSVKKESNMTKPEYPSTWEAILSKIPTALHDVVKPALQEWDQGVNKRFQELAEEWAPFKEFKESKVDPNYLRNALSFAQAFENDPTGVLKNANETYNLGFGDPDEYAKLQAELESFGADDDDNDFEDDDTVVDLASDPNFKALQDTVNGLAQSLKGISQETDAQKHEKYLDNLLADKKHINRTFITALMTQGLTGEQAIDEYNKALASSVQTPTEDASTTSVGTPGTAPVVMGPDGTAGAGTETKEIDFGTMGTTAVNDMVAQMLQAAQGNE